MNLKNLISGIAACLFLAPDTSAEVRPAHPYRYSIVDMPVSLALGTVRTPEFTPLSKWYFILLQVERPLPFRQMKCMMAITDNYIDEKDCTSDDPLLQADWTVFCEGQVVMSGSSTARGHEMWNKDYIFKFLGNFPGKAGKKYVLEVKFTKDGTRLNVANPHLIVTKIGNE